VDARLGDSERGLSDRLNQAVGETRRTLAETLEARVGDTERGLADRLERTVDQTRRTLAETLEARVGDTERGLVSRLELSVGETRRELEASLGARVAEGRQDGSDRLDRSIADSAPAEPSLAVSEFEQRLDLTERDASDRLQQTLAQLVSRVDQVAVEELDEFVADPVAPETDAELEAAAPVDPEPASVETIEPEPAPAPAREPAPELTAVHAEPQAQVETPHGVYGDDGLAPFSAFASADGFRHAPLELDDPFVPAAIASAVTTVLAEASEPEAPVVYAASAAPQAIADHGHEDAFHVDDEFVAAPVLAKAPAQASAEPAPAEEWSFDVEPLELDTPPSEAVQADLAPEPEAPVSPTRRLIEEARAKAKAASEEGKSGRKAKSPELGAPPPMTGLGGSRLRAPNLVGGLLSRLGKSKAERDGAGVRTTALVAVASFAVSAMGAGAWLLNERSDAGEPAQASADGVKVTTGEAPAAPRAAALTLDAPSPVSAPATPAPEAAALYAAALTAFRGGDNEAGLRDLRLAADGGHAQAQLYLADLYDKGRGGLERDPAQARRWTASAAALGNRTAMHNLAMAFVEGEGGPTDFNAAAQWFRRAADQGLTDSQYNLGYLFEQGRGVAANPAEAYKWYLIAARLGGDAEARASAERLRPTLTPVAQATAERTALAFRPAPAPVLTAASAAPGTGQAELAVAQQALSRLGFYRGPTDGAPSPALARAIAAWQASAGLEPTGALSGESLRQLQTAAG
jgi:localization factor PodJL